MRRPLLHAFVLSGLCLAGLALAQTPVPASAPAVDPRVVTPDGAVRNDRIQRIVTQDRNAKVEELRVREQTQHITVTPASGAPYEVIPADSSRDTQDARGGSAGRTVWRVLSF